MAFSQALAARVRHALARTRGIAEKRMFGGLVFLMNGNMLVGVWHDSLIARLGREAADAALQEPHVGVFEVGGRVIRNWALIDPDGLDDDRQLNGWLDRAMAFVETLPAK